ncbi:probable WRKY transcription factor 34 [Phragmites australis]|uniref:probable WRKY transcription factor 34 n=1 Tax=Phragmites australis TaxID=29695 RepID=UPI002D79AE32|nr:probable WRKY transcription factor 34 [Phragmites australis]
MDGHVAMEWKDLKPGPESLMPSVLTGAFPPDTKGGKGNEDAKAGFEKHGLSVATSSPLEEGQSLPMTPQFGQKSGAGSSLAERMQARAGFSVPKLSMPFNTAVGADNSMTGAPSPYLTIPPGLSPATLLESPVFLSNAMGQASPTTGKLLMLGGKNDTDPIRFEGPLLGYGPDAFSFKPLETKSSHYTAEEKKEFLCNNQRPSIPSTHVSVKTETKIQTVQEANLLGQVNQQKLNGQTTVKNGSQDSKLSSLAPDTAAGNERASPPDHGQPTEEGDARGDYPAMVTAAPAEDGYSWRKYGQKQVKHSEYPRSYYKCTHPNCQVKKKVERSHEGHITEIIYKGTHNHPKPAQSRRPGVPPVHPFGDTQTDGTDNPGSQPNAVEARPLWHNNASVQDLRGDGLDATSSPSVPGELCDSSASMQVSARFEPPEGVDVTSAVSDEVDGDDRVTHGSLSQGGADAEGDELESKRRKLESYAIDMSTASRAVREPRVVIQTTSEVDILDDGYRWRKYGQKVVKGNPNPRSYYKCTHPGCLVRKHVERASHDLESVITTYEGKHNHEVPAARNSGHPSSAAPGAAMAAPGQAHAGARRPEHLSVQDCLMRLGGCGVPFGLPPRDPLAPMGNYPYSTLGPTAAASLPSLPMPPGLEAVEGLKLPMLAPPLHPFLRHRQTMEPAGLVVPKGEVKGEAHGAGGNGPGATASVYQQLMRSRLSLGHQV